MISWSRPGRCEGSFSASDLMQIAVLWRDCPGSLRGDVAVGSQIDKRENMEDIRSGVLWKCIGLDVRVSRQVHECEGGYSLRKVLCRGDGRS
jgi:hypothetical protein